jgi:hypothetical protein
LFRHCCEKECLWRIVVISGSWHGLDEVYCVLLQVLTPMQAGTFMVQAFPWAPDMLALANTVAEEASAPPVKQIFDEVLRAPPTAQPHLAA